MPFTELKSTLFHECFELFITLLAIHHRINLMFDARPVVMNNSLQSQQPTTVNLYNVLVTIIKITPTTYPNSPASACGMHCNIVSITTVRKTLNHSDKH